jgi:hypothetical protein
MYKGFPNTVIHEDEIKKVIKTEKVRENFQKYGFFMREGHGNVNYYALGPNSINLISNWKLEELNHRMIVMNAVLIVLTLLILSVTILDILYRDQIITQLVFMQRLLVIEKMTTVVSVLMLGILLWIFFK